jgi:hypothetical protein
MDDLQKKPFGFVAQFNSAPAIYQAAEKVRDQGFTHWDTFTPFPVHGLDRAMGIRRSTLPRMTLAGGILGFITGNLMTWFMNAFDYPLIVGGKPYWSPIFPFPVHYELTILFAAFGTFFGMFLYNRLPQHYHPVFDYPNFSKIMDDSFLVVIEAKDPQFDIEKTKEFLLALGGQNITLIES